MLRYRLGEIPPRLGGLKIQNGSHNDLLLDTDLSYLGSNFPEHNNKNIINTHFYFANMCSIPSLSANTVKMSIFLFSV